MPIEEEELNKGKIKIVYTDNLSESQIEELRIRAEEIKRKEVIKQRRFRVRKPNPEFEAAGNKDKNSGPKLIYEEGKGYLELAKLILPKKGSHATHYKVLSEQEN